MINTYTEQIERYENLSTWYAAFSVICILIIMMLSFFLIIKQQKEKSSTKLFYNIILSAIFLIIPCIVTLYLYVFAMNMRKVALYRGYLHFLEEQWNNLAGSNLMLFNNEIMQKFFSLDSFLVNGLGPSVMAIFIIFAMLLGFGMSVCFIKKLLTPK